MNMPYLRLCHWLMVVALGRCALALTNEKTIQTTKVLNIGDIMSQVSKRSAGLLMYRRCNAELEVFLVHPGGPFGAKKDLGAWSIPKGEYKEEEKAIDAAKREFQEETGFPVTGELIKLGEIKQLGGKKVKAWAFEGDCDPTHLRSNTFSMEWPPRSGRQREFPEVDYGAWFTIVEARKRLKPAQCPFLDRLIAETHEK
jgi:predicted NUDIX family NTP pyrophosphohydrolase